MDKQQYKIYFNINLSINNIWSTNKHKSIKIIGVIKF